MQEHPNTPVAYSRGRNTYDAYPEQRAAPTWEAFTAGLLADCSAKKGQGYICGPLKPNGDGRHHRCADGVIPRTWLALDCDGCDPDTFAMLCVRASAFLGVGWMTASSTRECPRFRGILALSRPVGRSEGMRLGIAIQGRLSAGLTGIAWDASVYRAEQPAFLPLRSAETMTWDGEPVDVDELLAEAPPVDERPSKRERAEKIASADPMVRMLYERGMVNRDHGDGKLSITCPFEREHSEPGSESASAYLLPHFNGMAEGRFHCLHAHCAGRAQEQFREALDGLAAGRTTKNDCANRAPFADTDIANARRLAQQYGDSIRFTPERGWVVWNGRRWAIDELNRTTALAKAIAVGVFDEIKAADPETQKMLFKWARASQSAQRVQAMLLLAQTEPGIPMRWTEFDADPWLVSCANGTVDLRTGALRAHNPKDYLSRGVEVAYDPEAACPLWLEFLNWVLPDGSVRSYVQRAFGYSLTGLNDEQCLIFVFGSGANGKSVLLEILVLLCGSYAMAASIETFTLQKQRGIPNDIARLAGARVATVSETEEGQRLRESLIKDLTGGDTITARFLNREFFDFKPRFKLWIRGNHKPVIRGTDDGIWRRIHLIPFNVTIAEEERDPRLIDKLKTELPGILAWAVQGCLDWQQNGLKPPAAVRGATRDYRKEMDTLGDFLAECCLTTPEAEVRQGEQCTVRAGELYKVYRLWCERGGVYATSQKKFGMALAERGIAKGEDSRGIFYDGIGLRAAGLAWIVDSYGEFSSVRYIALALKENPGKPSTTLHCPRVGKTCPKCGGEGCRHCGDMGRILDDEAQVTN